MIPVPSFKRYTKPTRVKGGKYRKHVSTKIRNDSLVTRTTHFDCGLGRILDAAGANETRFLGYKFTKVDPNTTTGTYPTLKWNDGIFWWYGNNFREIPAWTNQTASFPSKNQRVPANTSNVMPYNRNLVGGTNLVKVSMHDVDTYLNMTQSTEENWANTEVPHLGIAGTSNVHQVSQKIDLLENMVYVDTSFDSDGPIAYTLQLYNGPNMIGTVTNSTTPPITNAPTDENTSLNRMIAGDKFKRNVKFAVRNIVLMIPHDIVQDYADTVGADMFGDLNGPNVRGKLEELLLSDLVQVDDSVYGPVTNTNKDLKLPINPKYSVLRDYVKVYGFNADNTPNCYKTTFNHTYAHKNPTRCDFDPYSIYSREARIDKPQLITDQGNMEMKIDLGVPNTAFGYDLSTTNADQQYSFDATADPTYQIRGSNIQGPSAKRSRREEGANAAADNEYEQPPVSSDRADQTGKVGTSARTGPWSNYQLKNPTFNPLTHRIVWLRLPRFYGSMELSDIRNNMAGIDSSIPNDSLTKAINRCGLRVRGYSQWKFLKPDVTMTGGQIAPLKTNILVDGGVTTFETVSGVPHEVGGDTDNVIMADPDAVRA